MMYPNTIKTLMLGSIMPTMALAQTDQPNIIMFLVDDMGWQETSVPFYKERTLLNDRYRTPNMERLAAMGVKFTNAYACPVSSPSRCSLMSGMNAARHRVTNWIHSGNTNASGGSLTLPDWNYNGIQPSTTTKSADLNHSTLVTPLPQLLKDAGYTTIHIGKGNFGASGTTSSDPKGLGFMINIGGGANGGPGSYLASENYGSGSYHVAGLEVYYEGGVFLTEALTREALKKIQIPIRNNKPFFLYMSQYAIHTPYNADDRFTGNYMSGGVGVYDQMLKANLSTAEINHAALVEGMDKSLGDILDFLEADSALAANTILLFMSDNGGQAVSPRQGRYNHDQNYPARGGKGSGYDGGIHEPMIAYWPGVTEGGTVNENRIMIEDFFPTILSLAGVTNYETVQTVDGRDFSDMLQNPGIKRDRVTIWHYPNRWGESADKSEGYGTYSGLMKGNYHLLYFWENQELRLYDLSQDPGEENNLADSKPELLKALAQELTDSLISMDAQRPTITTTGEVVPWPNAAEQQETYAAGDIIPPSKVVTLSTDESKTFYTVVDNRSTTSYEGPFFWTLGNQYGFKAVQVTNENYAEVNKDKATDQYFYFTQGKDAKSFNIFTYDGKKMDYVPGTTRTSYSGTTTATMDYLQYDTENSGEFNFIVTNYTGYYGIQTTNGVLLCNRGTSHGSEDNMGWTIMTYSGNSTSDQGSRYTFMEAGKYEKPVAAGDVVKPSESIFKMSDDEVHYLYSIQNHRATPFYWVTGNYAGQPALQATQESYENTDSAGLQQFYFMPGSTDDTFTMYTASGSPIAYIAGQTRGSWNNGIMSIDGTYDFMQYKADRAGDLQLIKTNYDGYYGIKAGGILISDRGTSHGSDANRNWVIMTYSGNSISDLGSRYRFNYVGLDLATAITQPPFARPGNPEIYTIDGRKVNNINSHGVYIIRENGVTRKILK